MQLLHVYDYSTCIIIIDYLLSSTECPVEHAIQYLGEIRTGRRHHFRVWSRQTEEAESRPG